MRVTEKIMVNGFLDYLNDNYARLDKYNQQIATGKKISAPSDSPCGITTMLRIKANLSRTEQFTRNISTVKSFVETTESTLADVGELIQHSKELAVAAANDTESAESRDIMAREIDSILTQLLNIGNQQHLGRYLFSGTETLTTTYTLENNRYIYNGDGGEIKQLIDTNISIAMNLQGYAVFQGNSVVGRGVVAGSSGITIPASGGDVVFAISDGINTSTDITLTAGGTYSQTQILNFINTASNNVSIATSFNSNGHLNITSLVAQSSAVLVLTDNSTGSNTLANTLGLDAGRVSGTDIFGVLQELSAALKDNDGNLIRSQLERVDDCLDQVLMFRGRLGSRMELIDLTENRLERLKIDSTKLLSDTRDVDITEAIMNYNIEQNVFEASLNIGSKLLQLSILDFLR
ncbi:MAG: flagellar hook-associated protein FlgL [bacterium]